MLSSGYGISFLISSHLLSEIESIADVIGIICHGKLIREISKLFEGELVKPYNQQRSIDRKSRKAMREKRAALGQKDTGMEL